MKQEPSNRMVSRGKYFRRLITKQFSLLCIFSIGIVASVMILSLIRSLPYAHSNIEIIYDVVIGFGGIGCYLFFVCLLLERGAATAKRDIGIPLTRANTADLPLPDSLVRASQEPLQAQQSVLLRAAMETTEGQEDELLRAASGSRE